MSNFNPKRVRLVDQVGSNLLLRGNTPIVQKDGRQFMAFDLLVRTINQCLASGTTDIHQQMPVMAQLPERFHLVSLSLLRNTDLEGRYLDMETVFFEQHPEKGILIHDDIEKVITMGLIKEDMGKQMEHRVIERLHTLLNSQLADPLVIYLHSAAGLDRTGAVVYSYAMRHASYAFQDAIELNGQSGLRQVNNFSLMAVEQYAYYLKRFMGISTVGEAEPVVYNDLARLSLAETC